MNTKFKYFVFIIIIFISSLYAPSIVLADKQETFQVLSYPKQLPIIKREAWGWIPIKSPYETHKIKFITIHHGGVKFSSDKNAFEHVRNLQNWSRTKKNWVDIPYHFMMDLKGNIFETRPINIPGDTNTEYDPRGHLLVEIMGNYEVQELSEQQFSSLATFIKFLSVKFNIPLERIKTHRDYSSETVCPGKNIYQYFENGKFIKAVASQALLSL